MTLNGNYIDLLIILVIIFFVSEAWRVGFWVIVVDFFAFASSLFLSLRAYKLVAVFLESNFSLSKSVSNALGFLLSAIIIEALLGYLLGHLISRLPEKLWKNKWQRYIAIIPAVGEAVILIAFILTLIISFPIRPQIKKDISESKIGGQIIKGTSGVESKLNDIFGGVIQDSLTYFTIKPGSRETIHLDSGIDKLTTDQALEADMFKLVNDERKKQGVGELSLNLKLSDIAREYAKDMWERQYFGHTSPEGKDVGDRLDKMGTRYSVAGENLALAPTLTTAHTGLMNSPGHKANILEPKFKKVGIGIIDNGIYGKMFVQVFTD